MVRHSLAILTALASLTLAGCTQWDAYHRQGVWQPTGANSANLAAMVANPEDLIHGRGGAGPSFSKDQVKAVEQVWSGTAKSGGGGGGGASGGGGAAASGG